MVFVLDVHEELAMTIDGAEVIDWCRQRMAGYKTPTGVDVVEVLPPNPAGKVLRRLLREPHWEGHDRAVG
jgi:long-chain acyl-CoA synthetase